ncbi:hypothetical protein JRO89_XS14G0166400 [Xanthoceras sorbifolium]|uniref:CCHC-type domain-containing protein n=1 Tax=Xanthoceras sorbifolium TaxID=99658 RepID=A0ABQ8H5I9_9ROSI|nr:hypothetical protein JRO89_XS14G0166400 [Xanthoceras sorbifolium]
MDDIEVVVIRGNTFVLHIRTTADHRLVLMEGPWCFDKTLIVLEEPVELENIALMRFDKVDFWVQIHNIPLLSMTQDIGRFQRELIGPVKDVDVGALGDCLGKYLRVRVQDDPSKPLKQLLQVDLDGTCEVNVPLLRYKQLPNFYCHCGLVGHLVQDCIELEQAELCSKPSQDYGLWLRASNSSRLLPLRSRQDFSKKADETLRAVSGEVNHFGVKQSMVQDQRKAVLPTMVSLEETTRDSFLQEGDRNRSPSLTLHEKSSVHVEQAIGLHGVLSIPIPSNVNEIFTFSFSRLGTNTKAAFSNMEVLGSSTKMVVFCPNLISQEDSHVDGVGVQPEGKIIRNERWKRLASKDMVFNTGFDQIPISGKHVSKDDEVVLRAIIKIMKSISPLSIVENDLSDRLS